MSKLNLKDSKPYIIGVVILIALAIGSVLYSKATYTTTSSESLVTIDVTIQTTEGVLKEESVEAESTNLYDFMYTHFTVEDDEGFIYSIEGIEQDVENNQFWVYTINDEEVFVGAKELILEDGDELVWELMQF